MRWNLDVDNEGRVAATWFDEERGERWEFVEDIVPIDIEEEHEEDEVLG